jgi:hypothetical protein
MSLWDRLFGPSKADDKPKPALREIPEEAMQSAQTLRCEPKAVDPERRFSVGKWGLSIAGDEDSHRLAKGVLKKSAGKTLRLEPNAEFGHRGVISSAQDAQQGSGYKWLYVDVDLRAGTIRFHQGGSEVWP